MSGLRDIYISGGNSSVDFNGYKALSSLKKMVLSTTGAFDISQAPAGITYFGWHGQNTGHGDIAQAPAGITHFIWHGQNTATVSAPFVVPSTYRYFYLRGSVKTQQEIDYILASLATVTTWVSEKKVDLLTHSAPSSAGLASKAIIEGRGATVLVET